ncbi:hypothetical protein P8C59_001164 [Phyllachora maydis]|uniref:Tim44-like domain-containing protein n=1 Tax=Phyllachora maydis TaxID=1825666 RepID=A0AAD9HXV4_9PEZI|nr:hypothetical protein P8C59_001164 [Phyllachora maydis]
MLPGTFVKPPFHKFPFSSPRKLYKLTWGWLRSRVTSLVRTVIFKLSSKPSIWERALWRRNYKAIIPQAKALHRAMSEALAAGNKPALAKVCVTKLSAKLGAAIDARPTGRRLTWELVKYNSARIADAKVLTIMEEPVRVTIYQVVVRIKSRQRLVEYDDSPQGGGRMVPGSAKELHLVENVVLTTMVDSETYRLSEWRIWGIVKDSTPESVAEDEVLMKALQEEQVSKHKMAHG